MTSLTYGAPDHSTLINQAPSLTAADPLRPSYQRQNTSSSLTASKSRRSLATLARNKTSNALSNLSAIGNTSTPVLRSQFSSGNLSHASAPRDSQRPEVSRNITSPPDLASRKQTDGALDSTESSGTATSPTMAVPEKGNNKMHQTSSKILRMTEDDRPFNKDFKDLFSTLITSLPLTAHRVRFSKVDETFLSEEAITNLGSLKFSQSNRIPDPKNPSRWVVTTTTTTFSMAKEMARSVCQRFVDARFIESAEGKTFPQFPLKGAVWQLTAKGIQILKRFCDRNGIEARHIEPLLRRAQMQIVVFERDLETDALIQDKTTVEVVFRRLAGVEGPNLKSTTALSDSDSVSEYATGLVGVKMAKDRKIMDKTVPYTFTGKAASDWLLDCCTTVDRRETYEMCELFLKWDLMTSVVEDRNYMRANPRATTFQPTKYAIYAVTEKGQRVCGWIQRPPSMSSDEDGLKEKSKMPKETNKNRLSAILHDAALRMLFREHLRTCLCEENLHFYLEVQEFIASYRALEKSGHLDNPDAVRETLATAYGLYNSFLAAGAPSELNIDHSLRHRLDNRMTQTETDEKSMRSGLQHVVELIELACTSVAKLMASDSVPKFIRDPRYASVLREHEVDVSGTTRALSPPPTEHDCCLTRSNTMRI